MKILIFDDDQATLMMLLKFIGISYEVEIFSSPLLFEGDYADYDLIILDQTMPDKSGVEIAKEIRAQGVKTVIIIMTAYKSYELMEQFYELEIHDYLLKPFNLSKLKEKIDRIMLSIKLDKELNELNERIMNANNS